VGLAPQSLADLLPALTADTTIQAVEAHEESLKRLLCAAFERGVTPEEGRRLAAFQRDAGLIMKYKPYAVKAATPLGFSIFLQEPGQGFSFQKHTVRKVEAFHILETGADGYVFLCSWNDWRRVYEPDRFQRWLDGAADDAYERFRIRPSAGDVYLITDRETVHTVIGCQIEEYASVSVDVVQRLHDQNHATPMPAKFTRRFSHDRLARLRQPAEHRSVQTDGRISAIRPEETSPGARRSQLVDCPELDATVWTIETGGTTPALQVRGDRAVQIYVGSGSAQVRVGDKHDVESKRVEAIAVAQTGTTMVAPNLWFSIANAAPEPLSASVHAVAWRPALETLDA
jgi:hypothetical protein